MKKLLVCTAFLIGCSNCSTEPNQPIQIPTTIIPDAEPQPTATPTQEMIDWKTVEELLEIGRNNSGICAMIYFPDIINDDKTIEELLKSNNSTSASIVKLINETFVSVEFPLTKEKLPLVMVEFQLDGLPTLMFSPPNNSMVLHIHGNPPADKLLEVLSSATKEEEPFAKCSVNKAKIN